jgi:hypothetical protein
MASPCSGSATMDRCIAWPDGAAAIRTPGYFTTLRRHQLADHRRGPIGNDEHDEPPSQVVYGHRPVRTTRPIGAC